MHLCIRRHYCSASIPSDRYMIKNRVMRRSVYAMLSIVPTIQLLTYAVCGGGVTGRPRFTRNLKDYESESDTITITKFHLSRDFCRCEKRSQNQATTVPLPNEGPQSRRSLSDLRETAWSELALLPSPPPAAASAACCVIVGDRTSEASSAAGKTRCRLPLSVDCQPLLQLLNSTSEFLRNARNRFNAEQNYDETLGIWSLEHCSTPLSLSLRWNQMPDNKDS